MHTHAASSRGKRGKPHSDTVYAAGSAKSETEKKGAILSASLQAIEDCVFSPCLTEGVHSTFIRVHSRSFAALSVFPLLIRQTIWAANERTAVFRFIEVAAIK